MKYYLHSVRMLWRSALQYRSSFYMQIVAQFIMIAGELMAVTVLLDRFHAIGQWQAGEILFFFGMMQMVFALTEGLGRGITSFPGIINSGEFDAILLRPRPLLTQVLCMRLDLRRLGGMLVGLAAMVSASVMLNIEWTLWKAALLMLAACGTLMLLLGLFLIEATVSFFSVKSIEMVNVLTYGGRTACEYPVDIYPDFLRRLFTWVAPFALCLHWPVSLILGKPMADLPAWVMAMTPLSGAVFFFAMVRIWYAGAKHYRSTGS